MQLFILRHGEAEREAARDRDRHLTARGREDVRTIIARNAAELRAVTHMLVSPYVRAQETAQLAREHLPALAITENCDLLIPEAQPGKLLDYLQTRQQKGGFGTVLLVSHQPLVGTFLDGLCGFEVGRYRMGTSALVAITAEVVAAGLGELQWLRHPEDR